MLINEGGLIRAIKRAYKAGGYTVLNTGNDVAIYTDHWFAMANRALLPRKVLATIVEHMGMIPERDMPTSIIKDTEPQLVLRETAAGKNGGAVLERRMSPLLLAWRRLCVQLARIWRTARTPSGACVIACCSALGKSKEAAYMGAWKPACLGISTVPLRALRVKQWSLCWTWLGFAFLQVLPARLAAENRAMY